MPAILDTSVIIRYFTDDPPGSADEAAAIIDGRGELVVPEVMLTETAHVLRTRYDVQRQEVVDDLVTLLEKSNIRCLVLENQLAIRALALCRPSGRVSFTDALTWAAAHHAAIGQIYTLDQRFPSAGVTLLAKPRTDDEST